MQNPQTYAINKGELISGQLGFIENSFVDQSNSCRKMEIPGKYAACQP